MLPDLDIRVPQTKVEVLAVLIFSINGLDELLFG
jgi:hypothetical protein